jgi:hypothetical protein
MEETQTPRKKKEPNNLQKLLDQGIPSHYVRFHQPVAPGLDREPVSEFRLRSIQSKYVVDEIIWTPHGVIFKAHGEIDIVDSANVIYCRLTV